MKRIYLSLILFLTLIFVIDNSKIRNEQKIWVQLLEIRENKLVYIIYTLSETKEIDLSDLVVSPEVIGRDPFNLLYQATPDFKLLLLENGYAKLKNKQLADDSYRNAENNAKAAKKGIWRDKSSSNVKIIFNSINNFIFKNLKNIVIYLISSGILILFLKHLYNKFYIQRRCKLLIIGEPFTGKTALLHVLINPNIEKDEIFKLIGQSSGVTKKIRPAFIPRGKFEIYPKISDIPGHFYGTVWDNFFVNYSHILIIVISAFKGNGRKEDGTLFKLDINNDIDQKYIYMQLGYVQSYIQGGLGSEYTKKPKLLIMYISKFDLFSKYHPDDSSSKNTKQALEEIFKEHIGAATKVAKDSKIPFKLIFGSAVEKWNTDKVLDTIISQLYGM